MPRVPANGKRAAKAEAVESVLAAASATKIDPKDLPFDVAPTAPDLGDFKIDIPNLGDIPSVEVPDLSNLFGDDPTPIQSTAPQALSLAGVSSSTSSGSFDSLLFSVGARLDRHEGLLEDMGKQVGGIATSLAAVASALSEVAGKKLDGIEKAMENCTGAMTRMAEMMAKLTVSVEGIARLDSSELCSSEPEDKGFDPEMSVDAVCKRMNFAAPWLDLLHTRVFPPNAGKDAKAVAKATVKSFTSVYEKSNIKPPANFEEEFLNLFIALGVVDAQGKIHVV